MSCQNASVKLKRYYRTRYVFYESQIMSANICNDSTAETPVHNNSAHEQLDVASALVGLLQRMIKSAAFGAKHVVFSAFFSVVSAVLVYLFMGASTSNTMSQPYIVKATAKHTASVSGGARFAARLRPVLCLWLSLRQSVWLSLCECLWLCLSLHCQLPGVRLPVQCECQWVSVWLRVTVYPQWPGLSPGGTTVTVVRWYLPGGAGTVLNDYNSY